MFAIILPHLWQKQGSVLASPDGTTTCLHAAGCVYHLVCPKVVSRVTRWVYGTNTQKRRDLGALLSELPSASIDLVVTSSLYAPSSIKSRCGPVRLDRWGRLPAPLAVMSQPTQC